MTSCTTSFIVIDIQAKLCMFMYINSYVNICVFIISMHKAIPVACRVENQYNTDTNTSIGFSMHTCTCKETHKPT